MGSLWEGVKRRLKGERRHQKRINAEKVQIVNRQWAVAARIAPRLGKRPEELFDYHRADRILGSHP